MQLSNKHSAGLLRAGLVSLGLLAGAASLRAHVPVPQCPSNCDDFMTGGGWIVVPGAFCNNKANFGFVGGIKNGRMWGSLNYKDHCTGNHIKGTDVKAYCFIQPQCPPNPAAEPCRRIVYSGTFDGVPVDVIIDVCDNGEPGNRDTFAISVYPVGTVVGCEPTTGAFYSRSGTLGGGGPGGGNIQLHRHCP